MAFYHSPLRYPGGKTRLSEYFKEVYKINGFEGGHYVEPYAGGAGVALNLLLSDACSHIHLNDLNYPLYCFWVSILRDSDEFCKKIANSRITVNAWMRHNNILADQKIHTKLDVGYSMFFLNRTNRSGIVNGGMIGGYNQHGKWKMDARFNKSSLIDKVLTISSYKKHISVYNLDAEKFLLTKIKKLPNNTLIYIDPPYYNKGQRLYDNRYQHKDHANLSKIISRLKKKWVISYDYTPDIVKLYNNHRKVRYSLNYSAASHYYGSELMIYSNDLALPRPNKPGIII